MIDFKISIICPVYNSEKYLPQLIHSITSQQYTNWELIAINDGSTDSSLSILSKASLSEPKIKIISTKNGGVSKARNIGLAAAEGDYILMLDSDDILAPDALSFLNNICHETSADIISFDYIKLYTNNDISKTKPTYNSYREIRSDDLFRIIFDKSSPDYLGGYVWLRLLKKNLLKQVSFNTEQQVYEDEDFFAQILRKSDNSLKIIHTPSKIYFYRQRASSLINTHTDRKKRLFTLYRTQRRIAQTFNKNSIEYKTLFHLRLETLINLQQYFISSNKPVKLNLFRSILLSQWKYIPKKKLIPYILGKRILFCYTKKSLSKKQKTKKYYWP